VHDEPRASCVDLQRRNLRQKGHGERL
jgi:hypothetical protein